MSRASANASGHRDNYRAGRVAAVSAATEKKKIRGENGFCRVASCWVINFDRNIALRPRTLIVTVQRPCRYSIRLTRNSQGFSSSEFNSRVNHAGMGLRPVLIVVAWNLLQVRYSYLSSRWNVNFSVESHLQIRCHVYHVFQPCENSGLTLNSNLSVSRETSFKQWILI